VSAWLARHPDLPEDDVRDALDVFCDPPVYHLPISAVAHTRHFMPDSEHRLGMAGNTDKVLDTVAVMARGASLVIEWPTEASVRGAAALRRLLPAVGYLGRAESLCEMSLGDPGDVPRDPGARRLQPVGSRASGVLGEGQGGPEIELLVPRRPVDLETLTIRTVDVRAQRRRFPEGAHRVRYPSPSDTPAPAAHTGRALRPDAEPSVTTMRWSIATPARPSRRAAVAMADALRQAAMSAFGRLHGGSVSPCLAGKDVSGTPLEGHRHAHYLALDLDDDHLLDTLVCWAPGGLAPAEIAALSQLRGLGGRSFARDFRPCRLGLEAVGTAPAALPELTGPSSRWVSHTPFAPPRHGRRNRPWVDHVAAEISRELDFRGMGAVSEIHVLPGDWLSFRRHRLTERLEDARRAIGAELRFVEPLWGPLALGALSHFGLGVFVPRT
jgi:CRISPR-associated protein Csb2